MEAPRPALQDIANRLAHLESGLYFTEFAGRFVNMAKVEVVEVLPDDDGTYLLYVRMIGFGVFERFDTEQAAWNRASQLPGITHIPTITNEG